MQQMMYAKRGQHLKVRAPSNPIQQTWFHLKQRCLPRLNKPFFKNCLSGKLRHDLHYGSGLKQKEEKSCGEADSLEIDFFKRLPESVDVAH
jgi:hypothetical protein